MNFQGVEICCPVCKNDFDPPDGSGEYLTCIACHKQYPVILGIPDLRIFPDPYIDQQADQAKGLKIAEHFAEFNFSELVDYYYENTDVVPTKHARLYKRGLLAAPARSEAALVTWERLAGAAHPAPQSSVLEIGCGTAPLLAAAVTHYKQVVGVDIAFRWLVVAQKRLEEAGVKIPLICACAEALPFPERSFDRVIGESTLEHVREQGQALTECFRVLNPESNLFLTTPNRHSLGPDPQAGIWAGGFLPEKWLATIVKRQGGIPPKRRLVTHKELKKLLTEAGFEGINISLVEFPPEQRSYYSSGMRAAISIYTLAREFSISRSLLYQIGPLFYATAVRPR